MQRVRILAASLFSQWLYYRKVGWAAKGHSNLAQWIQRVRPRRTRGETSMAQSCSQEKNMQKFLTVTILIYFIQPDPRNKYFACLYNKCFLKGEINWFWLHSVNTVLKQNRNISCTRPRHESYCHLPEVWLTLTVAFIFEYFLHHFTENILVFTGS